MNQDIRFDFQRRERIGLIEAIWGEDKSDDQLIRVTKKKVAIVAGGSSDLYATLEAKLALEIYGISCQTFIDVGVAGLHRLFNQIEEINKYDVLIVCAGMEGALVTVIGGLLPQPIIAVPVSVGYGVSKNGATALNSMLSSCAPGIAVMNIDNGYGAAMAALRIIKSMS